MLDVDKMAKTLKIPVFTSVLVACVLGLFLLSDYPTDIHTIRPSSWSRSLTNDETRQHHSVCPSSASNGPPPGQFQAHLSHSFSDIANYHKRYPVDCSAVFQGDRNQLDEIRAVLQEQKNFFNGDTGKTLVPSDCEVSTRWLDNCDEFRGYRGYPSHALSKEEEDFPIAYSIVVYKDAAQVERLLRAIYQPQNVYCIHMDLKSSNNFLRAIKRLASCFDNVFVASKLERVQWGGISAVLADLHCMDDLLRSPVQWKYFINLCGQDFPLKTNLGIVRQLKAYNSYNSITGTPIKGTRFEIRTRNRFYSPTYDEPPRIIGPRNDQPPITLYKGDTYIAATREFVDFVVNSNISRSFLSWLNDTLVPDEAFTPSLQRLSQGPGGCARATYANESNVRFRKWDNDGLKPPCYGGYRGKYVRSLCIFASDYLQYLWKRPELFVNKFHYDYDPVTMQCMEELLEYRTRHPEELQNEIEYFPIRNYSWQQNDF